ncbi:carboxypeptidase-like regulatory domain-containing protein [Mariniflexile sp.]|uniref:carboxypeptidase-like regulatory domain-containing protein n=1 Tax=Mariniflexile sp. TaxID=1979402 RepID=UPI004048E4B8
MKYAFTLFILAFTSLGFSQNTGMVVGKIMDNELQNRPLVFSDVAIKGTSIKSNTDVTGLFVIENLKDGDYTLVYSFVGYETQELNVKVVSGQPTEVKLGLSATTVSLLELASITSVAQKDDKTASVLN